MRINKGDEYQALLDYAEAYYIFKDYENQRQMGICIQNMAALRFEIKEYNLANLRYEQSVKSIKTEIDSAIDLKDKNFDLIEANFLLACRLFQTSLTDFADLNQSNPHLLQKSKFYKEMHKVKNLIKENNSKHN